MWVQIWILALLSKNILQQGNKGKLDVQNHLNVLLVSCVFILALEMEVAILICSLGVGELKYSQTFVGDIFLIGFQAIPC